MFFFYFRVFIKLLRLASYLPVGYSFDFDLVLLNLHSGTNRVRLHSWKMYVQWSAVYPDSSGLDLARICE